MVVPGGGLDSSQRPVITETDLFHRPYAQDDLISLRSEDEMAGVLNGGGGGRGNENDLLRPIFDAIDSEGHGYITVEKFFEEMDRYSNTPTSAEKKTKLHKTLDPDDEGIVTYENFVTGVLMFRLEETGDGDPMSLEDEAGYEHLVSEWTVASANSDEMSNAATNWSTNGDADSPEDLNIDFDGTLTASGAVAAGLNRNNSHLSNRSANMNSHKNRSTGGSPTSGLNKRSLVPRRSQSINDRFKSQDVIASQQSHHHHHHMRSMTPGGLRSNTLSHAPQGLNGVGVGAGAPGGGTAGLFDGEEDVYSTYSDYNDNNDDALSVSSAQNPPSYSNNYRDELGHGMDSLTIPRITRGSRGIEIEQELTSFNPMRLNGHTVNQGHYDDLSDLDAPGPSNLMSSRSMSEADRRKREITTPARLPWGYPQESAASLATRRTYGHRRANSNMSNISRSPRPRSPGANSAVDDACSHLSESDAYMLDHKFPGIDLEKIDISSPITERKQRLNTGYNSPALSLDREMSGFENQIRSLQQQLENYVSGRAEREAVQLKLREDKNNFQNRALMLEEQLSEVKRSHEDEVRLLRQTHSEDRQQLERDCREKVEQIRDQMREMDQTSHEFKSQVPRLTGQLELLKEDKQRLEDKVETRDATISQLEVKLAKLEEEKERVEDNLQMKLNNLQVEHKQLQHEYETKVLSRSPSRQGHYSSTSGPWSKRGADIISNGGVLEGEGEEGETSGKLAEMIHKCNLLRNENSKLIEKIHELESSYRYLESRKSLCDSCRLPLSGRVSIENGTGILSDQSRHRDTTGGSLDSLDDMIPLDPESSNSPLPTCNRTPPPHHPGGQQVVGQPTTSNEGDKPRSLAAELAQVLNKPREFDMSEVVKDALEQNKSYENICMELKQQEQINDDLQNYLSRLLLLIMESNPEILEVK
ncbi:uncharacterized protein LOC142336148 isoform X3 [Convolutriloba macropyga]|uniref:uncharacterized protein LOC142336148 isoform X3 n=1 Tax=Convolutriloba macropyga TaxID=536237 RepID=UPI003F524405